MAVFRFWVWLAFYALPLALWLDLTKPLEKR